MLAQFSMAYILEPVAAAHRQMSQLEELARQSRPTFCPTSASHCASALFSLATAMWQGYINLVDR
jgi:hypothetical protein